MTCARALEVVGHCRKASNIASNSCHRSRSELPWLHAAQVEMQSGGFAIIREIWEMIAVIV